MLFSVADCVTAVGLIADMAAGLCRDTSDTSPCRQHTSMLLDTCISRAAGYDWELCEVRAAEGSACYCWLTGDSSAIMDTCGWHDCFAVQPHV
jgi:hypothetical protein